MHANIAWLPFSYAALFTLIYVDKVAIAAKPPESVGHVEVKLWNMHNRHDTTLLFLNNVVKKVGWYGKIRSIAFSSDGRLLAVAAGDGLAKIWDIATGREIVELSNQDGHSEQIQSLAFFTKNQRLVTADRNTIKIYDLIKHRVQKKFCHQCGQIVFSSDGRICAGCQYGYPLKDEGVKIYDTRSGQSDVCIMAFNVVEGTFSIDRTKLATVSCGSNAKSFIQIWDINTKKELTRFFGSYPVAFSPNGDTLAMADEEGASVIVW